MTEASAPSGIPITVRNKRTKFLCGATRHSYLSPLSVAYSPQLYTSSHWFSYIMSNNRPSLAFISVMPENTVTREGLRGTVIEHRPASKSSRLNIPCFTTEPSWTTLTSTLPSVLRTSSERTTSSHGHTDRSSLTLQAKGRRAAMKQKNLRIAICILRCMKRHLPIPTPLYRQ